jgi:hypothetical protein
METTKNKLTINETHFFEKLSSYLESPMYYFGSIQRTDYFPGKSDIDIDIFTDNESSVITKMQHFLHEKPSSFKKFVWRLNHNNRVVYGYKIMYINAEHGLKAEFSIYNNKVKQDILNEHNSKVIIPFYILWCLNLIKILYYNLNLIDKHYFRYLKKKLLTFCMGLPDDDFVIIDPAKPAT